MVDSCLRRLILDLRPQNFLLTFGSTAITIKELLAAEKSQEQYGDPKRDMIHEDPNGIGVIYASRPVALVADGELVELGKMKVKIADFGKGSFMTIALIDSIVL